MHLGYMPRGHAAVILSTLPSDASSARPGLENRETRGTQMRIFLRHLVLRRHGFRSSIRRLQVLQQALELALKRIVVLPVGKILDEVLGYLPRQVLACFSIEAFPAIQSFVRHEPNGKQLPLLFRNLTLAGVENVRLHPLAVHAVLRQDQEQLVMQADGRVNLLVELFAGFNIVRRKPAAHAFILQAFVQTVSKLLVLGGRPVASALLALNMCNRAATGTRSEE